MYFRGINLPPEGYLYTKRRIWCIDSRLRVLYSGEGKIATEHSSQHRIGLILKLEILTLFFFSVSLLFSMFPVWYQLRGLALRAFVSNFCSSFPPPSPHLPKKWYKFDSWFLSRWFPCSWLSNQLRCNRNVSLIFLLVQISISNFLEFLVRHCHLLTKFHLVIPCVNFFSFNL